MVHSLCISDGIAVAATIVVLVVVVVATIVIVVVVAAIAMLCSIVSLRNWLTTTFIYVNKCIVHHLSLIVAITVWFISINCIQRSLLCSVCGALCTLYSPFRRLTKYIIKPRLNATMYNTFYLRLIIAARSFFLAFNLKKFELDVLTGVFFGKRYRKPDY